MSDEARAHREEPLSDDSEEHESWLRDAVRGPDADSSAGLPLRGEVLGGKYRIEDLLGRGGMGAVFRATHLVSEKPVAIKWMLRAASDDQARRRFAREARAAGRIDHPNVVDLYDVCQEGDRNYLVMELLRGESLRKRFARGPLDATEAVDLLLPVMRGVAAAHQAGVVHRDLKPDNIFLCEGPDGSPREAKVLDFGVSSIAAAEGADSTLTQEGALLGSPAYMSPEQLRNPHDVDARTDVYAFGVILYEALAGVRPFQADSYGALIFAITNSDPKPLSQARAGLPPGLEPIVLRALAREQTARYPNMASLVEALQPFGSGRASAISQRSPRLSTRRPPRGLGWLTLTAILASLLLAGWGVSLLVRSASAPSPAARVSPSSEQVAQPAGLTEPAAVIAPEPTPALLAPTAEAAPPPQTERATPTPVTPPASVRVGSSARAPAVSAAHESRTRAARDRGRPATTSADDRSTRPAEQKARTGHISIDDL